MKQTLTAHRYVVPRAWTLERAQLFARTWQFVGLEEQLPQPAGARATTVAGWPLLLVRTQAGELRGYHNVCRHRAAPLVWDGESTACTVLRCRYHGWRYDQDTGALEHTPDFGAEVPAKGRGLMEVHLASWQGLLFAHLGPDPIPLLDGLGDLPELLAGVDLGAFRLRREARHPLACNWKTYVENYLEGLHIPYLHPGLSKAVRIQDYQVEVGRRCAIHRVPTRDDALAKGLWAWLWPNLAVNFYGRGLSLEHMVPTGPQSMEIRYLYLFEDGVSDDEIEASLAMSSTVTDEDRRVVEAVQRNLAAGAYHRGVLSPRHEEAVAAFQGWVRESCDAP